MIQSIKHKGLKLLAEKGDGSKMPPSQVRKIKMIMEILNAARGVDQINIPGCRLHPLTGDRKGDWSLTVSRNFRLTFRVEEDGIYNLNY